MTNNAAEYELELEKVRRHVREAEDRLARQRQIVAEMEGRGNTAVIELGKSLLKTFEETLRVAVEHVHVMLARQDRWRHDW